MMPETLGVHLLLLPRSDFMRIPSGARMLIDQAIRSTCKKHSHTLYASHVTDDHLHVLVEDSVDRDAVEIIYNVLDAARGALKAYDSSLDFDDNVHLTILPPWHLEILASFVRDQKKFHERFTVQEELEKVFLPNAVSNEDMVPS